VRWPRIKSVILHAWHHLTHSVETWVDIFWFPMIQALVFGGIAVFFVRSTGSTAGKFVVMGIILWYGMEAGSYSIAIGTLWEVWAHSFSSLFVSPLTVEEFVAGHMIFGLFKQLVTITILSIVGYLTFHFSILSIGITLPLHFLLAMTFGCAIGMFVLGLILRFGTRIQSLAWGFIYIIQPIVGVFYPISVLPLFLQQIAFCLPPTYVFESARHAITNGAPRWDYLVISFILDLIYFVLAYIFMKRMWEWARSSGELARMEE
jgi:ABC-2 type transport system permease protein